LRELSSPLAQPRPALPPLPPVFVTGGVVGVALGLVEVGLEAALGVVVGTTALVDEGATDVLVELPARELVRGLQRLEVARFLSAAPWWGK